MTDLLLSALALVAALAALAGLYALRWRDYRLTPSPSQARVQSQEGISILLPVTHLTERTEACIRELRKQDYPTCEIIVIEERPRKESRDELKRLKVLYPGLRYTAVPLSSRHIDRRKMAITLGFRAAYHPWVVLTQEDCVPAGPAWLATLAQHFGPETDIVTGYANYADTGCRRTRNAILERLLRQLHGAQALRRGTPYTADACNLAIRRDFFLQSGGFQDSLRAPFGCLPLFVGHHGTRDNVRASMCAEGTVLQKMPTAHALCNERLSTCETARYYTPRGKHYRLRAGAASTCNYALWGICLARAAEQAIRIATGGGYRPDILAADALLLLCLAFAVALPVVLLRRNTKALGERHFGAATLQWFALTRPVKNLVLRMTCLSLRRSWGRSPLPAQDD